MPEKVVKADLSEKWKRRTFLKTCGAILAGPTLPGAALAEWWGGELQAQSQTHPDQPLAANVLERANPIVGTGWRGHMFPGATAPFGLVQLSPDSSGPPDPKWNIQGDWYEWQHCSGYNYRDNVINGFSHTHVQGTGGIDLGDVLVMPTWKERTGLGTRAKSKP